MEEKARQWTQDLSVAAGGCWLSFPCIKTDRRMQALIQLIFPLSLQSGALDYGIVRFLYLVFYDF